MVVSNLLHNTPFFSICVPQHNRTAFLIEACKCLAAQTYRDFEVCISDDRSTDGREQQLLDYLQNSGLSFIYKQQAKNLRYDGNIRASIGLARGKYCILHGNDDCLSSVTTLETLYQEIQKHNRVSVVITNYEDWRTGEQNRRIRQSRLVGSGPKVAVGHFRNLAFVSGIVVDQVAAQAHYTDKWDGSEMYQMFIVSRILASGGTLLELDLSTVRKDIQIVGEQVDSFAIRPKVDPCPILERKLPMVQIGPLIADAIAPYLNSSNKASLLEKIFLQLYLFTYPYWIVKYRQVQSWKYALGVCLGIRPKNVIGELELGLARKFRLLILYCFTCMMGLSVPIHLFGHLQPMLFSISKYAFVARNK